jgi:choline dehydrogenase-like flavoprotein
MGFLSDRERRALASLCETFIPLLPETAGVKPTVARFKPLDAGLLDQLEEAYEKAVDDDARRELKLLLTLFETSAFNGLLNGKWSPLSQMSVAERERILYRWATSPLFLLRKAFNAFKRLTLFLGYAPPLEGEHPLWDAMGYRGAPPPASDTPRPIQPLRLREGDTLTTDVLIVGSGAGGGVVAGELSAAGLGVVVVEKGGYYAEQDFIPNERVANETLYEKYGALTTKDTAMMVLAGATLGGGTVVNWNASFRTPRHVLEEWARDYGFTGALSDDLQDSTDAVWQRLNINSDESHANPNHQAFIRGCEALGYPVEVIPRNVKGCEDCGFCNFGCTFGAKQSTTKTYLLDAVKKGARIVVKAHVVRVTHANGAVTGAELRVTDENGAVFPITVKARAVVVSAGAIHTPAILKRSGLGNPHIGANLHLHPTTVIFSIFDEPIEAWHGAPLVRVSKKFMDMDGKGYGVALEVAPSHPGLMAATLPWIGGASHKHLIGKLSHMANAIAITRDYYSGHVGVDKHGEPVLHYALHPYDRAHLQRGVLEALKIHQASGAREIYSPHNALVGFVNDGKGDFEAFLRKVEAMGLKPNDFPLFSAHQMSTCRIGGSPTQGAIDPDGQTYEVRNLFVADGSALPTATGVNPMVSIMALSHYLSQRIKTKLGV